MGVQRSLSRAESLRSKNLSARHSPVESRSATFLPVARSNTMTQAITIFGHPVAPYPRTVRMMCIEKGVEHTLEVVELGTFDQEPHVSRHPWGKIPAMQHGDFALYESSAMCRYIDAIGSGPSLYLDEARGSAYVEQWISAHMCEG